MASPGVVQHISPRLFQSDAMSSSLMSYGSRPGCRSSRLPGPVRLPLGSLLAVQQQQINQTSRSCINCTCFFFEHKIALLITQRICQRQAEENAALRSARDDHATPDTKKSKFPQRKKMSQGHGTCISIKRQHSNASQIGICQAGVWRHPTCSSGRTLIYGHKASRCLLIRLDAWSY